MAHPYSGPASYIYANEYLDDDEVTARRIPHFPPPTSILSSPPVSPISKAKPWSPIIFERPFASVPQFSTDFQSDRYKKFSRSSHVANASTGTSIEPYGYESMRVRFDTPNEHILAWRRKLKFIKRKLGRFRREVTKLMTHNWITTPRPRLSMI
ncbi:hypothetical protein BDN70DRAFT_872761, partial [Pholiota conissans]